MKGYCCRSCFACSSECHKAVTAEAAAATTGQQQHGAPPPAADSGLSSSPSQRSQPGWSHADYRAYVEELRARARGASRRASDAA